MNRADFSVPLEGRMYWPDRSKRPMMTVLDVRTLIPSIVAVRPATDEELRGVLNAERMEAAK